MTYEPTWIYSRNLNGSSKGFLRTLRVHILHTTFSSRLGICWNGSSQTPMESLFESHSETKVLFFKYASTLRLVQNISHQAVRNINLSLGQNAVLRQVEVGVGLGVKAGVERGGETQEVSSR